MRICLLTAIFGMWTALALGLRAQEEDPKLQALAFESWDLMLDESVLPPSFAGENPKKWKSSSLFDAGLIDLAQPAPANRSKALPRREGEVLQIAASSDSRGAHFVALRAAIYAAKFVDTKLVFKTHAALRVFVNGSKLGEKMNEEPASSEAGRLELDIQLPQGDHRIQVFIVRSPGSKGEATFRGHFVNGDDLRLRAVETKDAARKLDIHAMLQSPLLKGLSISPDGQWFATTRLSTAVAGPKQTKTLVIRHIEHHDRCQTIPGASQFAWQPNLEPGPTQRGERPRSPRFAYTTTRDKKTTLWQGRPLEEPTPILRDDEKLRGFRWQRRNDALFLLTKGGSKKPKSRGVKKFRGLNDRSPASRSVNEVHSYRLRDGRRLPVVIAKSSLTIQDLSWDGRHLLFSRPDLDYSKRPFSRTILSEYDLDAGTITELARCVWFRAASYRPTGEHIEIRAGASNFGGRGRKLKDGVLANDYDVQLFMFDRKTLQALAVSKDFSPSIDDAQWNAADGALYLRVTEGPYHRLFRYFVAESRYERVDLPFDALETFSLAQRPWRLAAMGSSARKPQHAIWLETGGRPKPLPSPYAEALRRRVIGAVKDLDFETESGTTIRGRVHYPPEYDARKSYPAIVYYYGGTVPTDRSFGGRYPKNLWAAKDYLVYVLQPSGAIGFGQEFSARHVNNWGRTVVDEIVAGTKAFLSAHTNVNPKRVGCIGASYGGFMTMLLMTQTDLFATGISHAGISSLSSYWGEGNWGYLYSAVANAKSYPWNDLDLFAGQSALFSADKFSGSLLLLHGAADTNVPKGESDQMYTALKILGKRVEYLQFEDEDHWILRNDRRTLWMKSIIAWFDRELKHEPAYWDDLYADDKAH